ncbi:MAG: winged helix-turn-helix domain-containing protein [Candidatus Thermoplasmatota archaeon]|nr:winged helix-turn-helix domain-containing protein [Candidatus Thermoplasmatota archaeon]
MSEEHSQDVVYKIFRLLRENVIKILTVLREEERIRWKELQEKTGISTATFNRSLAALQEVHFITKEKGHYRLTWAGRLLIDGFLLLGWRMADKPEDIEDVIAERVLAKDIVMVVIMIIFVSLRLRGRLDLQTLEGEIDRERSVIARLLQDFEDEGYLRRENGLLVATDKFSRLTPEEFFSLGRP